MKRILILASALPLVVGCSKGGPTDGPVSPVESKNTPTPVASQPLSANTPSPQPSAVTSSTANQSSPTRLPVESRPMQPDHASPPAPPKDNPAAAPPRPGETVVTNDRFEVEQKVVEVEGVCKLTEDNAVCWKPDGQKNDALATELTNAIKSKTDSYSSTFQFKFMKKNRILVVKTTTKPMKPNGNNYHNYGLGLMNEYSGGRDSQEGWNNGNSAFSSSSGSGFDQTQTERQVLTGAFNKETKTFPLRYQVTNGSNDRKVIPFAKGQFTIEGNTYEIVSVSDKPDAGMPNGGMYNGGMRPGMKPPKYTYIKLRAVKITSPYTILSLSPTDDSGLPYGGLNENGDPITAEQQRKQQEEERKKMMEAQQAGKPYSYMGGRMNGMNFIQPIGLDPSSSFGRSQPNGIINGAFNVEASKIKKLSVSISKRTVYVFDKIKLDAN